MSFASPEDEFIHFLKKFKTTVLWKWKDRTPHTYCKLNTRDFAHISSFNELVDVVIVM